MNYSKLTTKKKKKKKNSTWVIDVMYTVIAAEQLVPII